MKSAGTFTRQGILILTLSTLGGCTHHRTLGAEQAEQIVPLYHSEHSRIVEPERIVIRDQSEWQKVWRSLRETDADTTSIPTIDFQREMVLVAGLGTKGSIGWEIRIDSLRFVGDDAEVIVHPVYRCGVGMAESQAVVVVKMPRVPGKVTFVERPFVERCGPP